MKSYVEGRSREALDAAAKESKAFGTDARARVESSFFLSKDSFGTLTSMNRASRAKQG